jgi:AcrR family transcriptional regulator
VLAFPVPASGLPPRPDESVWPYLDAAIRCIERFGYQRTSVRDVAREAGVERTTVYRNVGSMDDIFALLVARELHDLMDAAPQRIPAGASGAEVVVELVASSIEHAHAHPVLAKVLADEPEVLAGSVSRGVPELIERVVATLGPSVGAGMTAGLLATRDPMIVTDWIVRVALSLLLAPPPGDLRGFLREVIEPVLAVPKEAKKR